MKYAGVKNRLTYPMYDTVQLAAAGNQTVRFFSVPLGGIIAGAVTKTNAHTNLVQAGRLQKGWTMEITGLSFFVRQTAEGASEFTKADYDTIFNYGFYELQIGQVEFSTLPLVQIGSAGAETQYFSNITAAATEYKNNHGLASIMNRFSLDDNILILEDQESIEVRLTIPGTIAAVTDITSMLWGYVTRPVR